MPYEVLTHSLIVVPEGDPIYSETATTVRLVDEAAGMFVEVEQHGRDVDKIAIDPEEWPAIRDAIDRMMFVIEKKAAAMEKSK